LCPIYYLCNANIVTNPALRKAFITEYKKCIVKPFFPATFSYKGPAGKK
jgi:hypothetical protein